MEKIKKCPFCGKKPTVDVAWNLVRCENIRMVYCETKKCLSHIFGFVELEKWNKRK
jgi:hypothetical protein